MNHRWMIGGTTVLAVCLAAGSLVFGRAQDSPSGDAADGAGAIKQIDELSYGVGYYLGLEVRDGLAADEINANAELLIGGFVDGLRDRDPMLDLERLDDIMFAVHEEMQARMANRLLEEDPNFQALHDRNMERGNEYQDEYRQRQGVTALESGLLYKVVRAGDGPSPTLADVVVVTARVTLVDGTEVAGGQAVEVELDEITDGGRMILEMMSVGAKWEAVIPAQLAYGAAGDPPIIGPGETLVVEVELLAVKPAGDKNEGTER